MLTRERNGSDVNRENFFDVGFPCDYTAAFRDESLIEVFGIDLPDPAGIAIAGRTDEDLGMNFVEMEGFKVAFEVDGHGSSLMEKGNQPKCVVEVNGKGPVWIWYE